MTDPIQPNQQTEYPDESDRLNDHLHHKSEEQFRRQMRQSSLLLSRGDGKTALPLLERCYALHPDDVNVLTNLGGAYILAGQHRKAIPYLEKAVELAPDNPATWSNLAAAYLGKLVTSTRERQENALIAYQRVIDLDYAYPNVHYNMGLIYVDRRDWDAAYEAFTRAIETNPNDQDAHLMRDRVETIRSRPSHPSNN